MAVHFVKSFNKKNSGYDRSAKKHIENYDTVLSKSHEHYKNSNFIKKNVCTVCKIF